MNILTGHLADDRVEMAERKGIGHPDTICDRVTEQISAELCRRYLEACGAIMHHNVDKALLIGGQSMPAYGGGKIVKSVSLIIAGRATHQVAGKNIPVEEIAVETARKWLSENIRHLDVAQNVEVRAHIRPGSTELVELFHRFGKGETPLANDTSFGAGFYPLTPLEENIIRIETALNSPEAKRVMPFIGEDIKVMGVNDRSTAHYTVALAAVDRYVVSLDDYVEKIRQVEAYLRSHILPSGVHLYLNAADDYTRGSIYLTVSGTSAESGDDGQVGRGNRINGLITPYRPMSLEATAGKNPVSHVGKIYNHFAMDLSRAVVEQRFAEAAQVFVVSQIGKPIDDPQLLHIKLKNASVDPRRIEALAREKLSSISRFWRVYLAER